MNNNFCKLSIILGSLYLFSGCAGTHKAKSVKPTNPAKGFPVNPNHSLSNKIDNFKGFYQKQSYRYTYNCPISDLDEMHRNLYYQSMTNKNH